MSADQIKYLLEAAHQGTNNFEFLLTVDVYFLCSNIKTLKT